MNLLFTICARAGSKGVKSKNIRNLLEYPIVYYTLSAYQLFLSKYGSLYDRIDIAINTDSDELVEQAVKTKIKYQYINRREEQRGDFVSKTDVIKDTLIKMQDINGAYYDVLIDLDLTSPLRRAEDIKGTIDALISDKDAEVSFSVTESRRLPYFNMVAKDTEGYYHPLINAGYVSRQQAPKCYDMNASIYAYHNKFISSEKTAKVFDGKAVAWSMKDTAVLDIDSEEDLELMQVLAKYFFDKYEEYRDIYFGINCIIQVPLN